MRVVIRGSVVDRTSPNVRSRVLAAWLAIELLVLSLAACSEERFDAIKVVGDDVDTHMTVAAGQSIRIAAQGKVDFGGGFAGIGDLKLSADGENQAAGSDYPAPNLRKNSLVVRIGDVYYQGGVDKTFVSATSGGVVLRTNDLNSSDNSSGWDVQVAIGEQATVPKGTDPAGAPLVALFDDLPVQGSPVATDVYVVAGSTVEITSTGIVDFGNVPEGLTSGRTDADGADGPVPTGLPGSELAGELADRPSGQFVGLVPGRHRRHVRPRYFWRSDLQGQRRRRS